MAIRNSVHRVAVTMVLAAMSMVVNACGATVIHRSTFNGPAVLQPPGPPEIGTSVSSGSATIAANPQDANSSDRWLRLARTVATQPGGEYIGTFTETVLNGNGSVALVGFIPSTSPIMMTVFFEVAPPGPPGAFLVNDVIATRRNN
jgi:hypothetical protein